MIGAVVFGEVFGGHIRVRSRAARVRVRGKYLGQAEIHQFHLPVAPDENVGGLDVAVYGLHLVRVVQGVQNLRGDVEGAFYGERSLLPKHLLQVLAAHVLHVNDHFAFDAVHVVDAHDVGMPQAIHHASLFQKPAQIARLHVHFFECHLLVEQSVFGKVDDAGHAMSQHVQPLIFSDHSQRHRRFRFISEDRANALNSKQVGDSGAKTGQKRVGMNFRVGRILCKI